MHVTLVCISYWYAYHTGIHRGNFPFSIDFKCMNGKSTVCGNQHFSMKKLYASYLCSFCDLQHLPQVRKSVDAGEFSQAEKYFQKCYSVSVCSMVVSLVLFIVAVSVLPVTIVLST